MDQRQLRYFVAVAETLHFGKAANRLSMTQPPLSQSIKALEAEIGSSLFTRTNRSVALTPLGAEWLGPVRAALDSVETLAGLAQRIRSGDAGRLEVSFVSTADYNILPALVQRFRYLYPSVELLLTEATSDVQISTLLEGKGNVGIIIRPGPADLPRGLSYRKLVCESLIAAVPENWITQGRITPVKGRLTSAAMTSSPLVVFPRRVAPSFYDLVMDYYAARGGDVHIIQHAIQMQTIISLVSAGMGIALVPASMRHLARSGVVYLALERKAPQLESGILWRDRDSTSTLANFRRMATASRVKTRLTKT
ncbi:LysR family transcriptional regulator [Acidobacterium sp. S8]|uniref:LysR family transcriptional regulator n=1 Tax=Acidobacterium sp. S8 TaxID=1641854 RepID=UPI00131CBF7C|nr:LysR family transcriptional regulator [Acidobacterium sp. S8]